MGTKRKRNWSVLQWSVLLLLILVGGGLLMSPSLTIQGVPMSIIGKFLMDGPARDAYWSGDGKALHDRLDDLGIEAEMKAFYRPQIPDEVQLDQHVHQIFYETTGYVGQAYKLDGQGNLVLKRSPTEKFEKWFQLAYKAGVVASSEQVDGVQYVISPEGVRATYQQISALYPKPFLEQLIKMKQAQ